MKLRCGVYGEGSVFSVDIEHNADVEALQEKIAGILSTEQHTVAPRLVTLYLAGKKEGEEIKWLKDDRHVKDFLRGGISTETSDPLVMKTFVHVEDPVIFRTCMAWKHKKVEQLRRDYFGMN
ncbi:hypothetical protein PI126_g18831 [Phytophthora idaei]|nr:hypothetical protein PI126_g18831 [Phytophthora idaei]